MRIRIAFATLSLSLVFALSPGVTLGQKGQFGPGGFGGGMFKRDPAQMFDSLSKGRGYFLISETNMLRQPLTEYAQKNGITGDKITRDQYVQFSQQLNSKFSMGFKGGPGGSSSTPPGPGGSTTPPPGTSPSPAPAMNADAVLGWAEAEFRGRDRNGDSFLNRDEMSENLKQDMERWDTNKDSKISLDEYKVFFLALVARGGRGDRDQGGPVNAIAILIEEEDLDRRPTVLRAGKLPKEGMPNWFGDMDTDKDGQVALYEWRKGGKKVDDFREWDKNDDGFVTPEEALRQHRADKLLASGGKTEASSSPSMSRGNGEERERGKSKFGFGSNGSGGSGEPWWMKFKKK